MHQSIYILTNELDVAINLLYINHTIYFRTVTQHFTHFKILKDIILINNNNNNVCQFYNLTEINLCYFLILIFVI